MALDQCQACVRQYRYAFHGRKKAAKQLEATIQEFLAAHMHLSLHLRKNVVIKPKSGSTSVVLSCTQLTVACAAAAFDDLSGVSVSNENLISMVS